MVGKYLLGGMAGLVSSLGPVIQGWIGEEPAAPQPVAAAAPAAAAPAERVEPSPFAFRHIVAPGDPQLKDAAAELVRARAEVAQARIAGRAERVIIVRCSVGPDPRPVNLPDDHATAPNRG